MGKQHLNTLSFATRLFERFSLSQGAGNVARFFINAARESCGKMPLGSIAS